MMGEHLHLGPHTLHYRGYRNHCVAKYRGQFKEGNDIIYLTVTVTVHLDIKVAFNRNKYSGKNLKYDENDQDWKEKVLVELDKWLEESKKKNET